MDDRSRSPMEQIAEAQAREAERVRQMLARDSSDRVADDGRREALERQAQGGYPDPDAIALPPPPEWHQHGEARHVRARPDGNSSFASERPARTWKRVTAPAIERLHADGLITDDGLTACRFYRDAFERSGLLGSYAVSRLGAAGGGGDRVMGLMAATEWEAEARMRFRFCQAVLATYGFAAAFNHVVLDDCPFGMAARLGRIRKARMNQVIRLGSIRLYQALDAQALLVAKGRK